MFSDGTCTLAGKLYQNGETFLEVSGSQTYLCHDGEVIPQGTLPDQISNIHRSSQTVSSSTTPSSRAPCSTAPTSRGCVRSAAAERCKCLTVRTLSFLLIGA